MNLLAERPATARVPLATQAEVSAYTGVAEKTLEGWRTKGIELPYIRVGADVRYRWSEVDEWLDAHTVKPEVAA